MNHYCLSEMIPNLPGVYPALKETTPVGNLIQPDHLEKAKLLHLVPQLTQIAQIAKIAQIAQIVPPPPGLQPAGNHYPLYH
jgi:hypothetical protein